MAKPQATAFGSQSAAYERARPGYPPGAVAWLARGAADIADVGAGTGKLTRALVALGGRRVVAVDPDPAMLAVLNQSLPDVPTRLGTGEHLPLPDASMDLVTFAQSWHWVDAERGSAEVARALRPGGAIGLVWNTRDESVDWVSELVAITQGGRTVATTKAHPFLGREFERRSERTWRWELPTTPEGLVDLASSFSYVITSPRRAEILDAVRRLAATHPDLAGRTEFPVPYLTRAYRARVR
ncbi:MAG: class I SAM-dependent methyltransferase [Propionibacteriaceae bacterium]|nr:class I SAM-dependent methyltransferase [Propionibacteriaceae bacterium]